MLSPYQQWVTIDWAVLASGNLKNNGTIRCYLGLFQLITVLTLLSLNMKVTLNELIERVESLPWDNDLYVAEGELKLDSVVAVIEDDGVSDTFEELKYFLTVQDIQSIAGNIQAQIKNPSPGQILEAIKHYHANDVFIQTKG